MTETAMEEHLALMAQGYTQKHRLMMQLANGKEGQENVWNTFFFLFNTACPTPALFPCSPLATLGLFRATLLFTLLRLLEHGEIAFHALAFFDAPAFHVSPQVRSQRV
jgi:hypothetical protein